MFNDFMREQQTAISTYLAFTFEVRRNIEVAEHTSFRLEATLFMNFVNDNVQHRYG